VYRVGGVHSPVFRQVAAPDASQLKQRVEQIAARVGQVLERRGPLPESFRPLKQRLKGLGDDRVGVREIVSPKMKSIYQWFASAEVD
jgi:hypothetical protein